MSLEFDHTCPIIDSNIGHIKDQIKEYLDGMLDEVVPVWQGVEREKFLLTAVGDCYLSFEDEIEAVRTTNEDMRTQAELQIDELQDERDTFEAERDDLADDKSNLEDEIMELKETIEELNKEIQDYES